MSEGHPFVFGSVSRHTGRVGARVDRVGDAVVIAIGGAAVRLGISGGDAGDIGARVDRVGDAVVIAIGRATVRLRIARADAGDGGARVFVVEDAVVIRIETRRWRWRRAERELNAEREDVRVFGAQRIGGLDDVGVSDERTDVPAAARADAKVVADVRVEPGAVDDLART